MMKKHSLDAAAITVAFAFLFLTIGSPASAGIAAAVGATLSGVGTAAGSVVGTATGSVVGTAAGTVVGTVGNTVAATLNVNAGSTVSGASGLSVVSGASGTANAAASAPIFGPSTTLNGPAPTSGSGSGSGGGSTASSAGGLANLASLSEYGNGPVSSYGNGPISSQTLNAALNGSIRAALSVMAKQEIIGAVKSVAATHVVVTTASGTRTLSIAPGAAATLRAFLGRTIMIRTIDGARVASIVGHYDSVRGTVDGVDGNALSFVTPSGEVFVMTLLRSAAGLRVGSRVVAQSSDFGKSVSLTTLNVSAPSSLADVYVGKVVAAGAGQITLSFGKMTQRFSADSATIATASRLQGKVVALDVPDGVDVKSMLTSGTLSHLTSGLTGQSLSALPASVVAANHGSVSLQLPNGDLVTYVGNLAQANLKSNEAVTIVPLDRFHARLTANAHAFNVANADACVTINSSCKATTSGHVVSATATALSVRFASGDVSTFLGKVPAGSTLPGTGAVVTALDSTHARVVVQGAAFNALDAHACVTINAGCNAMTGTVKGTSPLTVQFADGSTATLLGNRSLAGAVQANSPILVQPLDATHAVAQAGTSVSDVGLSSLACDSVNASCSRSTTSTVASSGNGGGNGSSGTGNASGNGSAGNGNSGNGNSGNGNSGNGNSGSGNTTGNSGAGRTLKSSLNAADPTGWLAAQVSVSEAVGLAFANDGSPNFNAGQAIVQVVDASDGAPLGNAAVEINGASNAYAVSDGSGTIAFMSLVPGDYSVGVARSGYGSMRSRFHVGTASASSVMLALLPIRTPLRQPTRPASATHQTAKLTPTSTRALGAHAMVCVVTRTVQRPKTICSRARW
jgi:hypothetical protein